MSFAAAPIHHNIPGCEMGVKVGDKRTLVLKLEYYCNNCCILDFQKVLIIDGSVIVW